MYDYFISFKCTDQGKKTVDCEIAAELASRLQGEGLSVFFSDFSLEQNGIAEYIKEINDAISSADTLILVCSNLDYIKEGWVAQEWTSFLNQMMTDKNKKMFTYLIGITEKELPALLGPFQSFRHADGMEEAVRYLSKTARRDRKSEQSVSFTDVLDREIGIFGRRSVQVEAAALHYREEYPELVHFILADFYERESRWEDAERELDALLELHSPKGAYRKALLCKKKDVRASKKILRDGQDWWRQKCAAAERQGDILLLVFDKGNGLLSPAAYMADAIHDILAVFGLASSLCAISYQSEPPQSDFWGNFHYVLFLTNELGAFEEAYYRHPEILHTLQRMDRNHLCLATHNLREINIARPFRKYKFFERARNGIGKYCRYMLNMHSQQLFREDMQDGAV